MYEYYYVLAKKKEMNVMNFCCKILGNYKKSFFFYKIKECYPYGYLYISVDTSTSGITRLTDIREDMERVRISYLCNGAHTNIILIFASMNIHLHP